MRFDLTSDQVLLYDTTRQYLDDRAPTSVIRGWADSSLGYDAAWWTRGAALGWTQLLAPESHGGGGVSDQRLVDLGLIAHAFGRSVAPGPLAAANIGLLAVDLLASQQQRERIAPALIAGDQHAAFCFAEEGEELDRIDTSATKIAGGRYRLDGIKLPVESAASASRLLVVARAAEGLRLFDVSARAAGVSATPMAGLDLNRRFAEVRLAGVEVESDNALGPADASAAIARLRATERVLRLCEIVGCLDRVFSFTCDWAFDRYSYGRPLASYQALKHRFADMKMWLEACHATTDAAVDALEANRGDADLLVHVACSYVGDHAAELIQDCVQIHGGIGVTAEHDLHLYLRRVTQNIALVGSAYLHRQRIADILSDLREDRS